MTQQQQIPMAILAFFARLLTAPASAAQNKRGKIAIKVLRTLCVVFFAAAIGGCGDTFGELMVAASKGDIAEVKRLLDDGADIETEDLLGYTPLNSAVLAGHTELVVFLIQAGADVNTKNIAGDAPLHSATAEGNIEIVLALVEAGADINAEATGWSPLSVAASEGQTEIALALIKAGADEIDKALKIAIDEHGENSAIARALRDAAKK